MRDFAHAGDLGDIIYSLPVIRELGGGVLRLRPRGYTDKPMTQERANLLIPLIEKQPYIKGVYFDPRSETLPGEVDLDQFRGHLQAGNLVGSHAAACGVTMDHWNPKPWLETPVEMYTGRTAVNRTHRYLNPWFDWREALDYGHRPVFYGMQEEFESLVSLTHRIDYEPTADMWELAKAINQSLMFVGNQSAPFAVAVGLGKRAVLAVSPQVPNCLFHRPNIHNYFMGAILPEMFE
jgi:hypothetical protein